MFFECYNSVTGAVVRPRAWGEKVGESYKNELISAGWHSKICSSEEDEEEKEGSAAHGEYRIDDEVKNDGFFLQNQKKLQGGRGIVLRTPAFTQVSKGRMQRFV